MTRDDPDNGALSGDLARAYWDEGADAWDHFVESGLDTSRLELHGPALLEHCGDVARCDVLDVGCGQGWFSRQLARRGARVIGVDWSARLIEHARRHERSAPLQLSYRVLDAARLGEHFAAGSFELITACMSLMDMPDPGRVLAAARGLLRSGGRIVGSIPHPVTDSPHRAWRCDQHGEKQALELDRYFEASTSVVEWAMPRLPRPFRTVQYRHTLQQWSCMFEAAGLVLYSLREPRPAAELLARRPDFDDDARAPGFLSFELRAAAAA